MPTATSLRPLDWIQAGFRTLTTDGVDRVKVEPLAQSLGVSKGSFYWHFKDRNALLSDMLQHWHEAATELIITVVEQAEGSAQSRLRTLVQRVSDPAPAAYGGDGVEPAIRAWARHDARARDAVERVDTQRIDYVQSLFREVGFSKAVSRHHANTLYATLIGLDTLSGRTDINRVKSLSGVLEALLSH